MEKELKEKWYVVECVDDYDMSYKEFNDENKANKYFQQSEWKCLLFKGKLIDEEW